jgi:hypothetical protein
MSASDWPRQQPLNIPGGADYILSVSFTDESNNPINISTPEMQIRLTNSQSGTLLLTPTFAVSSNTVTVTVAGSSTQGYTAVQKGYYDLFATRTDNGERVKLLYGQVTVTQPVTALV